jgi:hypothetical protein
MVCLTCGRSSSSRSRSTNLSAPLREHVFLAFDTPDGARRATIATSTRGGAEASVGDRVADQTAPEDVRTR